MDTSEWPWLSWPCLGYVGSEVRWKCRTVDRVKSEIGNEELWVDKAVPKYDLPQWPN